MILNSQAVNIWQDYKPITEWSIEGDWFDGQWKASDLGSAYDVYKSEVTFKGPETLIQTVENTLETYKDSTMLMTCEEGEEIFGAEIDYTGALTVVPETIERVERVNMALYSFKAVFRLYGTPVFKSLSPSLSALTLRDIKYTATSTWDRKVNATLNNAAYIMVSEGNQGIFEAEFVQRPDDMANIRRYILNNARTNDFSFPLSIDYPFGHRAGTGPFTVRIVDWEDLGRFRYSEWGLRIKFARVYT